MAFEPREQLDFMHKKLNQYAQLRWLNKVLVVWEEAYKTAFDNVVSASKVKKVDAWDPGFHPIDFLGPAIGSSVGASLIFIPVSALAKKLGAANEPDQLPEPNTKPYKFISKYKLQFADMYDQLNGAILNRINPNQAGGVATTEAEFKAFLSRALLSPLWYPPKEPNADALAIRFELRMWAELGAAAIKNESYNTDYTGMSARLFELKEIDVDPLNVPGGFNPNHALTAGLRVNFLYKFVAPFVTRENARPAPTHFEVPNHVQVYTRAVQVAYARSVFGSRKPVNLIEVLNGLPAGDRGWSAIQ